MKLSIIAALTTALVATGASAAEAQMTCEAGIAAMHRGVTPTNPPNWSECLRQAAPADAVQEEIKRNIANGDPVFIGCDDYARMSGCRYLYPPYRPFIDVRP
jgi:hypothetical protein